MESKNLNIIQKICHVLEILFRIAYALCIVGLICTIIGAVTMIVAKYVPEMSFALKNHAEMTSIQGVAICSIGFLGCLCGIVPVKLTLNWLKMEQEAGTPFTKDGASSLRQLGILYIVFPVVMGLVSAIIVAIFSLPDSVQLSMDGSLGDGILLILLSYVFAYGAELEEKCRG